MSVKIYEQGRKFLRVLPPDPGKSVLRVSFESEDSTIPSGCSQRGRVTGVTGVTSLRWVTGVTSLG